MINRIYDKFGTAQATHDDALEKEKSELEYALQTAMAEVERVTTAYQVIYQTNADITKIAYQLEATLFQSQLEALDSTQTIDKFGVNIASAGCLLLGDPTMCNAKHSMQTEMMERKKELMEDHRSSIPKDIIKQLPSPRDLLSHEFKRLAQKYPSKLGQDHVQPRS